MPGLLSMGNSSRQEVDPVRDLNLVLFAGRQVLPNLDAALFEHFVTQRLAAVFVLHTSNVQESYEPARRLEVLLISIAATDAASAFTVTLASSDYTPDAVRMQLQRWINDSRGDATTASRKWLVSCHISNDG